MSANTAEQFITAFRQTGALLITEFHDPYSDFGRKEGSVMDPESGFGFFIIDYNHSPNFRSTSIRYGRKEFSSHDRRYVVKHTIELNAVKYDDDKPFRVTVGVRAKNSPGSLITDWETYQEDGKRSPHHSAVLNDNPSDHLPDVSTLPDKIDTPATVQALLLQLAARDLSTPSLILPDGTRHPLTATPSSPQA